MPLSNVEALSDDDGAAPLVPAANAIAETGRVRNTKRRFAVGDPCAVQLARSETRQQLSKIVSANCWCFKKSKMQSKAGSCLRGFQEPGIFDRVLQIRWDLRTMNKEDSDRKAPTQIAFEHSQMVLLDFNSCSGLMTLHHTEN